MRRGGGLSDEDKERLGLEEKKARGRTLADVRTSVHLRGVIYTRICRNVCGSGRINPFFAAHEYVDARTHEAHAPSVSLSLPRCSAATLWPSAPLQVPKPSGFQGICRRAQLWPNKTFITITPPRPPPSAPPPTPPRLMNHHCTFHGVRFILIKRSRALFFLPLFWAPETNGVSGMFLPTFLPPAGRRDPGSSSGNWIGRVGLWFISVGGDHRV